MFRGLEYSIVTTWDDQPVDHDPVNITLENVDDHSFKLSVNAPFFNDPPNPGGQVGEPLYGLWEYEGIFTKNEQFNYNQENYLWFSFCKNYLRSFQLLNYFCSTMKTNTSRSNSVRKYPNKSTKIST